MMILWPGSAQTAIEAANIGAAPEGRHNVTLVNMTSRAVANGVWINSELIVDSGPHKGSKAEDSFYFGNKGANGKSVGRIGAMCLAANFEPQIEAGEIDPAAFCAIFPVNKLRFNVSCHHEFSLKKWVDVDSYAYNVESAVQTEECKYSKYFSRDANDNDYTKADADAWKEKGGQVWTSLVVDFPSVTEEIKMIYQVPVGPSERAQSNGTPAPASSPHPTTQAVASTFGLDDDLPF